MADENMTDTQTDTDTGTHETETTDTPALFCPLALLVRPHFRTYSSKATSRHLGMYGRGFYPPF